MEFPAKTQIVPGEWLEALAERVKLRRTEWQVVAIVLSSPDPVTASSLTKRFHLDYGLVKRVVRELIGWNILERSPSGLQFQPDHTRWGPPLPPVHDVKTQPGVRRDSDRGQSGHDHLRPQDSLNSNSA